jgi:hypothetical protein
MAMTRCAAPADAAAAGYRAAGPAEGAGSEEHGAGSEEHGEAGGRTLAVLRAPADAHASSRSSCKLPWWSPGVPLWAAALGLQLHAFLSPAPGVSFFPVYSLGWWLFASVMHVPYAIILILLTGGLVERLGYFFSGRRTEECGKVPENHVPRVCVQLPMFNEHEVCERVIEAACALRWPRER